MNNRTTLLPLGNGASGIVVTALSRLFSIFNQFISMRHKLDGFVICIVTLLKKTFTVYLLSPNSNDV